MIKFLLIVVLFCYLLYRVGGFLFRMLFIGAQQQQRNQYQGNHQSNQSKKAPGSNLNIDHIPQKDQKNQKDFNGGEYVDFEEVK
ncbi:MAG: DUF4834 family protein [Marinoscillum sp.]